ncbi:MAG: GlsB/YeaQ/YmgE family stress response membrane protein [Candidatus Promineifilaceae bacterium]|nr:GlsB/YeaQ/YmgE family stress response membrane protein [Candidatus Promineifilaceae bacterium]
MFLNLILWIILGGLAGWIAARLMSRHLGLVGSVVVGVVGALLGGLVFNQLGLPGTSGFSLWSLLVAVIGSVLLLAIINVLRRA